MSQSQKSHWKSKIIFTEVSKFMNIKEVAPPPSGRKECDPEERKLIPKINGHYILAAKGSARTSLGPIDY